MGVVIPAQHAQVAWHTMTDGDAEEMITTCGFYIGSALFPPALADVAGLAYSDNILPLTSTVTELVRVVVKEGPSATGAVRESTVNNGPGSDTGSLLPPNCAVLVRKITSLGGRKGRGRFFLAGISSISGTLDSAGSYSAGAAETIRAAVQDMIDQIESSPLNGPFEARLLHSDVTTPTTISGVQVPTKIATQRRRLRP